MSEKCCKVCGENDPSKLIKNIKLNKTTLRSICKKCRILQIDRWKKENPEKVKKYEGVKLENLKRARKDPKNLAKIILRDCKGTDRKLGLKNDLSLNFIDEQVAKGCSYCGETEIRMSLDRIDNARGHTKDNVVPACHRCNYVRLDMPYEAWLEIAPKMREAREKGAFGDWMTTVRGGKRKAKREIGIEPTTSNLEG